MSLNFDRYKSQQRCEAFLGCTDDLDKWYSSKRIFEGYSHNYGNSIVYSNDLRVDAIDLYKKGLLSLLQSTFSIQIGNKSESWLSVMLYYSLHYFLRASLAANGIGLIRNGALYFLSDTPGSIPIKGRSRNYQTTHGGVIHYFMDNFKMSDKLLSNEIDDMESYVWFKEFREVINYRISDFQEPKEYEYWQYINSKTNQSKLNELIDLYYNDPDYLYCFQEDHAVLALPLKRARLTLEQFSSKNISINYENGEKEYYLSLTKIQQIQNISLTKLIP